MARRTKIIATIGPASSSPDVLKSLMAAGMDVARLNPAHGTIQEILEIHENLRRAEKEAGRPLGVLVDLPGPKIRTAPFPKGGMSLKLGQEILMRPGNTLSTPECLQIAYDSLCSDLHEGDRVGLADGQVVIEITESSGGGFKGRVLHGGHLMGRPGFHIPSERLSLTSPTTDDLRIADAFVEAGVDFLGVSFVRSSDDLRKLNLPAAPDGPLLVAKIETTEAVKNLSDIVKCAGAVMVARGDLGLEFPIEELPHLQKRIVGECVAVGLPAITATQMLNSMMISPVPTRAEVSDVANAVFDGTSAVMLSGETAIGEHPEVVVKTMARIAERADEQFDNKGWARRITDVKLDEPGTKPMSVTDAMTMAASRVCFQSDLAALLCVSGSGLTVRSMARFRPDVQILGFSTNPRTVGQLTLSWGVEPLFIESTAAYEERVMEVVAMAMKQRRIHAGDLVGVLAGISPSGRTTDVLRLMNVPAEDPGP